MKITEVSLRRVYNLGNYETVHIEVKAVVDEHDEIPETLNKLKKICDDYKNSKTR